MTPIARPIQSLTLRFPKKEPWPQSCWMHEEAHEEQAVDRRDQEGAEIAVARDPAGKDPQEDEADDADGEFEAASHHIWFAVFRQDLNPVARGGGICAVGVMSHRR